MSNQDLDIRGVASLLKRQSKGIILVFVATFFLAGMYLFAVTPTFTATALLMADPTQKNLLDPSISTTSNTSNDNARIDSEVEIIRSDAVTLEVISAQNLIATSEFGPHLKLSQKLARSIGVANASTPTATRLVSQTLSDFKKAISVRRRGLTYLIAVSVTSETSAQAANLANAISATYIDQQIKFKTSASLMARDVLNDQIEFARQRLANSENTFDQFVDNNIERIVAETRQENLTDLTSNLREIQHLRRIKESQYSKANDLLRTSDFDQLMLTLEDQALVQLNAERQMLFARTTVDNTPNEIDIATELRRIEQEIQQRADASISEMASEIGELAGTAKQIKSELRNALVTTDLPIGMLTEIYQVQQEADIARSQYQTLLLRLRDIETQSRIHVADSRIVSPALAPLSPSNPNKGLVMLVSLAAAVGLGFGFAFLNEYYIGGITSAVQLSEILQTASVTIPAVEERNSAGLSIAERVIDSPLSTYAESVRKLRAEIDQKFRRGSKMTRVDEIQNGNVILISSALPSEGKTTTALALARTYALAGKRTLLIDADLRNPSVHQQLGYEPDVGFLEYLRNPDESEISGSFYNRDPASPLALIMGAGRSDIPTDQLLNSATFEALLKQAKEVYDIVVIDSPPLLPIVDARYIAHQADAVVMVVKWATTSQSDLRSAVDPLRAAMREGAGLFPVLSQKEMARSSRKEMEYYSGYSAAI